MKTSDCIGSSCGRRHKGIIDYARAAGGTPRDRGEFMFANPGTQTPTETRGSTPRMSPGLRDGAQGPYTVVQGDNLTRIARRHGMGLQDPAGAQSGNNKP